eukprot:1280883-Rhodomonas_salina.1
MVMPALASVRRDSSESVPRGATATNGRVVLVCTSTTRQYRCIMCVPQYGVSTAATTIVPWHVASAIAWYY